MTATNMFSNFIGFRCSPPLSKGDRSLSSTQIFAVWLFEFYSGTVTAIANTTWI